MSWLSDSSKLFKKRQIIIDNESFVVALPKAPEVVEEPADPVEEALHERHFLLSDADEEAQEIIAGAKKTAEEIILDAYDKAEEVRRLAREDGYSTGFEHAKGEFEERLEIEKEELRAIKQELLESREQLFLSAEKEMIELVLRTVERMISKRVQTDEDLAMELVQRSVAGLTHINHIVVRISERDQELSDRIRTKLMLGAERIETVEIKIDETLPAGSCIVETDRGSINASLDLQLERVKRAFRSLIEDKDA